MYRDIVGPCPLLKGINSPCAVAILLGTTVQVCQKKEILVGYGELAKELFILQKGSLEVSVPQDKRNTDGSSDRRSKGPGGGSMKKGKLSSQMIEREGSLVGLWNPYDKSLKYPYQVQANSMSTMLNISRSVLTGVMAKFGSDRDQITDVLAKVKKSTIDALKLERSTRNSKGPERAQPEDNEEEIVTLGEFNVVVERVDDKLSKVLREAASSNFNAMRLGRVFTWLGGLEPPTDMDRYGPKDPPPKMETQGQVRARLASRAAPKPHEQMTAAERQQALHTSGTGRQVGDKVQISNEGGDGDGGAAMAAMVL